MVSLCLKDNCHTALVLQKSKGKSFSLGIFSLPGGIIFARTALFILGTSIAVKKGQTRLSSVDNWVLGANVSPNEVSLGRK